MKKNEFKYYVVYCGTDLTGKWTIGKLNITMTTGDNKKPIINSEVLKDWRKEITKCCEKDNNIELNNPVILNWIKIQ